MTNGKWLLPLLAILLALAPSVVSADTFEYKGETWTFYPELGETQASITMAIDYALAGPPPPPDWPIWVAPVEIATAQAPVIYQNPDSGPSVAEVNMEKAISEYNATHDWMDVLPF